MVVTLCFPEGRTHEDNDLYHEMIDSGVISLKDDSSKAIYVPADV